MPRFIRKTKKEVDDLRRAIAMELYDKNWSFADIGRVLKVKPAGARSIVNAHLESLRPKPESIHDIERIGAAQYRPPHL